MLIDSVAFEPKRVGPGQYYGSANKKQTISGQNALLSLISLEDFEGIRNQIHSKIKDRIDENPASEEAEADEENKVGPRHPSMVIGEKASPIGGRKNNFFTDEEKKEKAPGVGRKEPILVRDNNNITSKKLAGASAVGKPSI